MGPDSDSPPSGIRPPPSGRKGSKKVRTGCITCKIRKVKCDEAKPFCLRCTKTGRRCDGYLDARTMSQRRRRVVVGPGAGAAGDPAAPLSLFHELASSDERRAFEFFQHVTAPCLSGDLDGEFWRVLVLQICQSEPAVRHAVLAVSSLHEGMVQAAAMGPYVNNAEGRRNAFALCQYNRAIACLLDQMRTADARPLVPLLTCVLFVCIELMQSKDRESLIHLEQGRQILSQLGRKATTRSPDIDLIKQHLVPMYTRLSLTLLLFGGDPVAIPPPLKTLTEVPMVFETLDEVRYTLYDFMDECLRFAKKSHVAKLAKVPAEEMREFERERDYLLKRLAKFNVGFSLYRSTRAREAPAGSIALIQIHAYTTLIWVSTALSRREAVFDDYVETFSAIIPLATEFVNSISPASAVSRAATNNNSPRLPATFTFEMHIIAPLYFVAAKCRHPVIRRAALDLLRRNPARRENLWRANVMAAIAERTMQLEERHLQSRPVSPHDRLDAPFPSALSGSLGADWWAPATHFGSSAAFDTALTSAPPSSTHSSSSSAATASPDDAASLVAGQQQQHNNHHHHHHHHLAIDPSLLFDATTEAASSSAAAAHSFSVVSSSSPSPSLDDPTAAAPYVGSSTSAVVGSWLGGAPSHPHPHPHLHPHHHPHHHHHHHRGPHPRSQPPSRADSRQPSPSEGSPLLLPMMHPSTTAAVAPVDGGVPQQRHRQPQYDGGGGGGGGGGMGGQQNNQNAVAAARMTMMMRSRSAEAPFDVPEQFRVHESVIGPNREDGTSWVMLFRKLGGLDAEWDVLTEYVAVG